MPAKGPLVLRALRSYPVLQGVPALLVGIGVLPEHVRSPAAGGAPGPVPATAAAGAPDRGYL